MRLLGFCSCRQLCALIQMCIPSLDVQPMYRWLYNPCQMFSLHQMCALQKRCAMRRAACHVRVRTTCRLRTMQTAVCHVESCMPCGQLCSCRQLCSQQTAVHAADRCAHCRQLGHSRGFCLLPPCRVPALRSACKAAQQAPLQVLSFQTSQTQRKRLAAGGWFGGAI